ncbi:MAG TPA: D-aminoacyl-tRNA deacylase [Pseudothermotoga sp.]|nr:D-aminoacyl-tRNA deacylase [Pseudothermotoga sp.]HPP70466.1 D-aminoacyl-tRNA deacylase [Pseudothermotoga sp.]
MRAVVQRVHRAKVFVNNEIVGSIERGLLVFLGVGKNDTQADVEWICDKIANLRVFEDNDGKMNLSVTQVRGEILVISQFTLYGDCRHGRRPSFSDAASPDLGQVFYRSFVEVMKSKIEKVSEGVFGAHMEIEALNDGPVTLLLDSERRF